MARARKAVVLAGLPSHAFLIGPAFLSTPGMRPFREADDCGHPTGYLDRG
jgi:hypothetical protein